MSEQPTREEIEWALKTYEAESHPNSIIGTLCRAARQYLASVSPPVPQEGTREPHIEVQTAVGPEAVDEMLRSSPPVPQEGVSEEMLERAMEGYWCNATENTHRKALRRALEAALAPLLEQNARLKQMDSEAATYVESVICMRTDFTGDPPYVGWKGLGLALTEALDERDAAEARVKELEAYAKHERSLGAEVVAIEALGIQQNLEARVKELEALQDNTQTALDTCMRQLNDAEDLSQKLRKL